MKGKRLLSLLLALVLCMAFALPCSAQDYSYNYYEEISLDEDAAVGLFEKANYPSYDKVSIAIPSDDGGIEVVEVVVKVLHVLESSTFFLWPATGVLFHWNEMGYYTYDENSPMGTLSTDGKSTWIESGGNKYTTDCLLALDFDDKIFYIAVDAMPTVPFTDVPDWCAYYVSWAVDKGITSGISETTFAPDTPCTHAQILTFMYRALSKRTPTIDNPYDSEAITPDKYYYNAMLWAYENGIVEDPALSPDALCTRKDVALYFARNYFTTHADEEHDYIPDSAEWPFTDVPVTADYAPAVAYMLDKGITSGTSSTTYSPDTVCTRGQIVTFIYRAYFFHEMLMSALA